MSLWWLLACWVAFSIPASLLAAQMFSMCSETEQDIRDRLEREWQAEVRRDIARADRETIIQGRKQ